jgi:membrane protein
VRSELADEWGRSMVARQPLVKRLRAEASGSTSFSNCASVAHVRIGVAASAFKRPLQGTRARRRLSRGAAEGNAPIHDPACVRRHTKPETTPVRNSTFATVAVPPHNARSTPEASVGVRLYVDLVKQAGAAWMKDRAPTMGAALAFYSAFALAPLLIIVIALAGALWGANAARGAIVGQLAGIVGAPAAEGIQALLSAAQQTTTGVFAAVVGIITTLVGATTLVVELQDDLDYIWKTPTRPGGLASLFRARILSLGIILGIGFLLLLSLIVSAALVAFRAYFGSYFPGAALPLLHVSDVVFSLAAETVLFAMLYKWLPNVRIAWKDVWVGAFITALLFSVGGVAIGLYLGRSAMASAYGAAGTLAVLLLWLYYSAQVFLFGAELTCVYANFQRRRSERASV